jgi:hypothetical protein
MGAQASSGGPLLFYVDHARNPQRASVGAALAAAAERAGWGFECYYDDLRAGRHFGGGDPGEAKPGWPAGSLAAGGRHADHVLWLASLHQVVALGDPASILWSALDAAGAERLAASRDPAELYQAAFERLEGEVPELVLVLDGAPQGSGELVVAPFLYPALLGGPPALAVDAASDGALRERLEALGARRFRGLFVEPARAAAFPGGLEAAERMVDAHSYASLTAELAARHSGWGRGVLLGDPDLVAAQLPRARRLRLLPLYGQPQTEAIEEAAAVISAGEEPAYGRQYDDHDFFALSRLGHGLQVVDPDPPFDSARCVSERSQEPACFDDELQPDDRVLERWAEEGRVLATLLLWSGMLRELHCIPRLIDLVAATGLRAGIVVTAPAVEHWASSALELLVAPVDRGGVRGLLEPLVGSTGRGVAAEALMPPGTLAAALGEARAQVARQFPRTLAPRGWWPLLDAALVPHRGRARIGFRDGRPVIRFSSRRTPSMRGDAVPGADGERGTPSRRPDVRALGGAGVRRLGLERLFEERRPFELHRPGAANGAVAAAVREAGFSYMWTKAEFGHPRVVARQGDFVALPFTAGNWDGWSPFYTVASERDVLRAERRLLRSKRPGWLASTVDGPLWALPAELWERGAMLYRIAALLARGGRSGRLVNTTPEVVARYARVIDDRSL